MFNQPQPLSSSISIADLAPRATTRMPEPRRGDGAFGEALKGARSVHERGESQVDRSRGETPRADRNDRSDRTDRTDRPDASRSRTTDRARTSETRTSDDATTRTTTQASSPADDAAAPGDAVSPASATPADTDAAPVEDAAAATGTDAQPEPAVVAPTIAVAGAPVADLDAIIVPTAGTVTHAGSDAVDAAMRLAISPTGAAEDGAEVPALTQQAAAMVDADVDADVQQTLVARAVQGTEDVETGDVEGPKRPLTSTPAATTGPTPAAAPTTPATVTSARPVAAAEVADAAVTALATGTSTAAAPTAAVATAVAGAAAQLGEDPAADVETAIIAPVVDGEEGAEPAATQRQPAVPNAATQPASPQAALQAQVHAQAQAKAAEQAADEGGEQPAPKLDASASQVQNLNTGRGDQVAATARMRDGMQLGGSIQDRIDHIAEQLSTRLRLSQAAGGSQVQLSLKPRELGDVHVQMKVRDGQVAAIILVDKPETARTMQAQIEDLKRSLENQGLQIQEFSVDVRGEAGAGGANARAAAEFGGGINDRPAADATNGLAGAAAANPGLDGDLMVDVDSVHDGDVSVLA